MVRRWRAGVWCATAWTVVALGSGALATDPSPPSASGQIARAPQRRLTRREYEHTLRDLLDLPGLAVRDMLPEDGRAHGFDRCADALDVTPVHVAAWHAAAGVALATATARESAPPRPVTTRLLPGAQDFFKLALLEGDAVFLKEGRYDTDAMPLVRGPLPHKLAYYDGVGLFPYPHSVGIFRRQGPNDHFALFLTSFTVPRPGRYRVTLSVWGFHWNKGVVEAAPAPEAVTIHANDRLLGTFDAPSLRPRTHTLDVWLNEGEQLLFTAASLPPARVYERPGRAAEYVGPGVALDHVEVEGPLFDSWPPAGHALLYGAGPKTDVKQVLTAFLTRAFRRPATSAEIARFTGLVNRRLKAGDAPDQALRVAAQGALCSPEFLFLGGPPGLLDDWQLAARLASFLHDSAPDEGLRTLARRGRLRDPATLRAETDRLLADPKAGRFIEHFLDEWLDLREIDFTTPDSTLYPEYDPHLRDAMLAETRTFFAELLAGDLPVTTLVDPGFAMVNQRLAAHYSLVPETGPVLGSALRRVPLPVGSPRGGLLAQAAILKVTANGTVTSPVKRGAWVLREVLDDPSDPPPPNVPAVDADVRGAVSIRDQLALHAADATCAACHRSIDPPGFALENFDVIGGWRDRHRILPGTPMGTFAEGAPVDAAGTLADGRTFASFVEFKALVVSDPERLARGLTRQLVAYSTGMPVGEADRTEFDAILKRAADRDYGVRTLIHEVIQSRLFREQ